MIDERKSRKFCNQINVCRYYYKKRYIYRYVCLSQAVRGLTILLLLYYANLKHIHKDVIVIKSVPVKYFMMMMETISNKAV